MAEFNDKEYKIEAKGEMPFASKVSVGYELVSNDRKMKFIVSKKVARNVDENIEKTYFSVACFVRDSSGWTQGSNGSTERSITDFVRKINISPRFTKAVNEYRKQLNITEVWR